MMWAAINAPNARALIASSSIRVPHLILDLGAGRFRVARFEYDGRWRLGRLPGHELPLEFDKTVAGFHAFIVREANLFLVDDPRPGGGETYVNGRPITKRRLGDRDVLTCGQTDMVVRCPPYND